MVGLAAFRVSGDRGRLMQFIDVMRTRYVGLPGWVRRGLAPALRLVPAELRYGETYGRMRGEIVRSRSDPAFVDARQTALLRRVLADAYRGSSYFRTVIDDRLGGAGGIARAGREDLARLPVLDRYTMTELADDLCVMPPGRVDVKQTSGSTCHVPAKVFLDSDRSVRETAFVHGLWERVGFRAGDRILIVRDGNSYSFSAERPWEVDHALNELRLSPYHLVPETMDGHLARIASWRPRIIYGLPSALSILALHALGRNWSPPPGLAGVFTSSETLFEPQREQISRAFGGVPVASYYGLTERTAFAGEVPAAPGIHEFEPLYGLTELVDVEGRPVTRPGEAGRIVSTGFLSRAMALLRYDTGDRARLVEAPRPGNCWRLRVSGIRSRWSQEFVVGSGGNPVSVLGLVSQNQFGLIRTFQFRQEKAGHIVFAVVPCEGVRRRDLVPLVAQMRTELAGVLTVDLEIVDDIPAGPNGKRRLVDQRLSLPGPCLVEV